MLKLNPYAAVTKRVAILKARKLQYQKELLLAEKEGVRILNNPKRVFDN